MTTVRETNDLSQRRDLWAQVALWTAVVAGVFVCAVLGLMAWNYAQRLAKDPLDSEEFIQLKKEVAANPTNQERKKQVQEWDLELRQAYFGQRRLAVGGAWLVLAGVTVLLVSLRTAATLRRKLPMPPVQPVVSDRETPTNAIARRAVGVLVVVLLVTALGLGLGIGSGLYEGSEKGTGTSGTRSHEGSEKGTGTSGTRSQSPFPEDWPTTEEIAKNWPYFRGPGGLGISAYDNVPRTWDVAKGDGILWKTKVPLEGHSSPIVWGDRIFLTGATQTVRQVYCFDTAGGQLLWQKDMPPAPPGAEKMPDLSDESHSGYAGSTPATDGRRVYTWFANGDLAAFDFGGEMVWSKSLGIPKNTYGHATSLAMWHNLLILQFDQGLLRDRKSKIMALDSRTGNTVWETPRAVPSSWCTPIVIQAGDQEQIVTAGEPWVIAYRPADGKELWRADCLRREVVSSPVFGNGLVYAVSESPELAAIRADGRGGEREIAIRPSGQGDVTDTHIAWTGEDNLPDTCSPLATPQYVFLLTTGGMLTCYDAKSGKKLWEHDFDPVFKASPSLAGKYIYLVSATDEGKVFVVEPGPTGCKRVAQPILGEPCSASPAFQDGRIYLRGKEHLFCIGKK